MLIRLSHNFKHLEVHRQNFMEKRFISFIVISFLILVGWQFAVSYFYPEAITKEQVSSSPTPNPNASLTPSTEASLTPSTNTDSNNPDANVGIPSPEVETVAPKKITIKTPFWTAIFDNKGGVLTSLNLHHFYGREITNSEYKTLELVSQTTREKFGAPLRLEVEDKTLTKVLNESFYSVNEESETIELKADETKEIVFSLKTRSGIEVEKRLKITGGKYLFDFQAKVLKDSNPLAAQLIIGPNFGDQSVKKFDPYVNTPPQILVVQNGKTNFLAGTDVTGENKERATKSFSGNIDWVASIDHYFAMAVVPTEKAPSSTIENITIKENETEKHLLSVSLPLANDKPYLVFVGPKDSDLLATLSKNLLKSKHDLEIMLNYGMFSFIVRPFIPVLDFSIKAIYSVTYNYGWGIIAITLLINLVFFPLKWKSSVAMEKAKKLQPRQREIQEKLKKLKTDDPRAQELQKEMMALFKEGNPLAGCLPLLLQLPIFWAIYIYLSMSINVRQSPFIFWVKDLSIADPTYILPIIMTVASMAATAIMPNPAPTDDPAQKMQRVMMTYIMPIVFFVLFFASAPSGLVLYWMFNSIFGVALQLFINKLISGSQVAPAAAKAK